MRKEKCASDGLLLEGKKKKPLNLLQRLGFDCSEKKKSFLTSTSIVSISKPFFLVIIFKKVKDDLKKMKIKQCVF